MPHSNNIITAPVGLGDVQVVQKTNARDLRDAIINNNLNIYSRCRPGCWSVSNGVLTFLRPTGNFADPRGINPRYGWDRFAYSLEHNDDYSHNAERYSVGGEAVETLMISSDYPASVFTTELVFNLGEVAWFNEDTRFHAKNDLSYTHIHAINASSGQIIGSVAKANIEYSGRVGRAIFQVSLTIPGTTGTTSTTNVIFSLGSEVRAYASFPDAQKTYIVSRLSAPVYNVLISRDVLADMKNNIVGLSSIDQNDTIYDVYIENYISSFTNGATTIPLIDLKFVIEMRNSGNKYQVSQARWNVIGTIKKTKVGTIYETQSFNRTWAIRTDMMYADNLPLNNSAANTYVYEVWLESFGITNVQQI